MESWALKYDFVQYFFFFFFFFLWKVKVIDVRHV